MSLWMIDLGICAVLTLLAFACFNSEVSWIRRCGVWVLFFTLGTALWFWTANPWVVLAGLLAWFVVPVAQAAYLSRRLSFPAKRELKKAYFHSNDFPEVPDISAELQDLGFKREEDYWLNPSPIEQGYRLFSHPDEALYASIAVVKPGGMHLSYIILATPAEDGSVWITWDYPLAYNLKMPPDFKIYRCLEAETVQDLLEQHRSFLQLNEVKVSTTSTSPADAAPFFERLFGTTINYNLNMGLLRPHPRNSGEMGYSWRGTAFISWQVLREMVCG